MDYLYKFPSSKFISNDSPNLIDSRVKYYTQWWLQNIHEQKVKIYSFIWNALVLGLFLLFSFMFLFFRYKRKPTAQEIELQQRKDQEYILSKIRTFQTMKQEQKSLYDKIGNLNREP